MNDINNICMGCMCTVEKDTLVCPHCGYTLNVTNSEGIYLHPKTIINNYIIGKVLGHGGFGITYLGMNLNSHEIVAIKEFFPNNQITRTMNQTISVFTGKEYLYAEGLEKFKKEANLLKSLNHVDGIVDILDFFEFNNTAYLVMEFIDGITLKDYVQQQPGGIAFEHAKEILIPIMDALTVMHNYKIIHRDISPDNIYITLDNRVLLLDFGAARYSNNENNKSLSILLKHGYAPKEQYYTKGKQGPWTDVYALAATIYYSITGQAPTPSLERIDDGLVLPSRLGADLTPYDEQVLMVAMSINESERFQDIDSFKKALLQPNLITFNSEFSSNCSNNSTPNQQLSTSNDVKNKNFKIILISALSISCIALAITLFFVFSNLNSLNSKGRETYSTLSKPIAKEEIHATTEAEPTSTPTPTPTPTLAPTPTPTPIPKLNVEKLNYSLGNYKGIYSSCTLKLSENSIHCNEIEAQNIDQIGSRLSFSVISNKDEKYLFTIIANEYSTLFVEIVDEYGNSSFDYFIPEGSVRQFVLPDSHKRKYSKDELKLLNDNELRIAINEMYARYGGIFETQKWISYFNTNERPWYTPTQTKEEAAAMFTEYEIYNQTLLVEIEKERGIR